MRRSSRSLASISLLVFSVAMVLGARLALADTADPLE
jgi:hypothetical protein